MADVYLGSHIEHGKKVALKVLKPELASNSTLRTRFVQEAQIQARIDHRNVVRVFDVSSDATATMMALEYVEGMSLHEVLERRGALPLPDTLRIFEQVSEAIGAAHELGVVHRDIKPSNILVQSDGFAKVADFGIARVLGASARLTRTGTSMGSPHYMSPEQVLARNDVDHRSDIYSLGAMLYETLAGRAPFELDGPDDTESDFLVKQAHVQQAPPDIRLLRPEVPAGVAAAIVRAMAKAPDERFQTAREFANALSKFRQNEADEGGRTRPEPIPPIDPSKPWPRPTTVSTWPFAALGWLWIANFGVGAGALVVRWASGADAETVAFGPIPVLFYAVFAVWGWRLIQGRLRRAEQFAGFSIFVASASMLVAFHREEPTGFVFGLALFIAAIGAMVNRGQYLAYSAARQPLAHNQTEPE